MKLWRREGIWQYRFQVGGKRTQASTGTKVKGEAEAMAMQAWQEAKARAAGSYVPTLDELRQDWLKAKAGEVGLGHWSNVEKWDAQGLGPVRIDRLTLELVELAREKHRAGSGRISAKKADATVAAWVRVLNLLMHWAVKAGKLAALPYHLPVKRPQKQPRAILPLAQVAPWLAAVDAAARNPQVGTAVRLMVGLGIRASEAMGARWEWIDWEARTYQVGRLVAGQFRTKGKEARIIDLPDWLHDHLLALRGDAPRLGLILPWKTLKDGTEVPHPPAFCRASIRAASSTTGHAGISAHRLRGTWITQLLRQGTPLDEVQEMAGHKDPSTTSGYYEHGSEVRKEAQKKLAERMGLA